MHIDTFKNEFVNKYMDLRKEKLPRGVENTRSKPEMVKASLNKALSMIFSPEAYPFFELPVIGDTKQGFYDQMKQHTLAEIEQLYFSSEKSKPDFMKAFKSMMLSETTQLQIYAAIAMMLKDSNEPEAQAFAKEVLGEITGWSGPLLGSLFINLRQFYTWVIEPLKNDIINNQEAENFMTSHKIIITMEDTVEETQTKLDQLYAKVKELVGEGADPQNFPNFSMTSNLQSFLGGDVSAIEAEA